MRYARVSLAALAVLFLLPESAFPQRKKRKLPAAAETIYLPTDPGLIRYQPMKYEGRYLRVPDQFGEVPDPSMLSKSAIKRGWDPKDYHIFDTSHETSEMRCYVRRSDKQTVDVAKGLAKGEKITLYGKLDEAETRKLGRMLRFRVFHIERGHEPKPVLTLEFASDKYGRKLYRVWEPKRYEIVYPAASNRDEEKKNTLFVDIAFKQGQVPQKKATSANSAPKTYAPVESDRIPYDTKQYVGKNLVVKDMFNTIEKKFPKSARNLGYNSKTHLLFRTPSSGKGSDMYCYVPRVEPFYCDLVEALVDKVRITLYGTLVAYDEFTLLRARHFLVDRVDIGWETKPAIEIKFAPGKGGPWKGYRFYKPYLYVIDFPPWKKPAAYTLRIKCIY
ncbi:MAG: hypothetical protein GXP25_02790 [Planctomycetes bacterium]|nr:hypothetical protein [Planctomycetota bacterium]